MEKWRMLLCLEPVQFEICPHLCVSWASPWGNLCWPQVVQEAGENALSAQRKCSLAMRRHTVVERSVCFLRRLSPLFKVWLNHTLFCITDIAGLGNFCSLPQHPSSYPWGEILFWRCPHGLCHWYRGRGQWLAGDPGQPPAKSYSASSLNSWLQSPILAMQSSDNAHALHLQQFFAGIHLFCSLPIWLERKRLPLVGGTQI